MMVIAQRGWFKLFWGRCGDLIVEYFENILSAKNDRLFARAKLQAAWPANQDKISFKIRLKPQAVSIVSRTLSSRCNFADFHFGELLTRPADQFHPDAWSGVPQNLPPIVLYDDSPRVWWESREEGEGGTGARVCVCVCQAGTGLRPCPYIALSC